ncbi:TPA: type 2 isopentenyl-diphosphate Delta-isomerase [Streptococcus suis]
MFISQQPQYARQRKDDHVRLALDQHQAGFQSQFDQVRLIHHSFSQAKVDQIHLTSHWANQDHSLPFYINGMTGGSHNTKRYNQMLAQVAAETGLAMASGSVSAALSDPSVVDSYTIIRKENPKGFVMANLGAHHHLENAKRAVDLLAADALQIHLNIPQEIVMPEGDRDFSNWQENIYTIVQELGLPVIVKEVGFGMSQETIQTLIDLGVTTIDLSGRGGTNFVQIENARRDQLDYSALSTWGQTTPESLLEASPYLDQVTVLASGGITTYLDIFKALVMGAQAVGLSGHFLHMVDSKGVDKAVQTVEHWTQALKDLHLMVGAHCIQDLKTVPLLLSPQLQAYAQARGIDWQAFGRRRRA